MKYWIFPTMFKLYLMEDTHTGAQCRRGLGSPSGKWVPPSRINWNLSLLMNYVKSPLKLEIEFCLLRNYNLTCDSKL